MAFPAGSLIGGMEALFPHRGRVAWIGVRPARRAPVVSLDRVRAIVGRGLEGDRHARAGAREVTLIQAEHLPVVAALLRRSALDPALLRRNLLLEGINLAALKAKSMRVGEAVLQITGTCHPCSRMEELLGPGGYNAMRGHGGLNARVVTAGAIAIGDTVEAA